MKFPRLKLFYSTVKLNLKNLGLVMSKKYRKIVFVNSVKANNFTVIKLSMQLFTTILI